MSEQRSRWPDNLWAEIQQKPWANRPWMNTEFYEVDECRDKTLVLYYPDLDEIISSVMDQRHEKALRLRYEQGRTYQEIGDELEVSAERAKQIVFDALRKLRRPECYYRLNAVPELEVLRVKEELAELTHQYEELKQHVREMFAEADQITIEKRMKLPRDAPLKELGLPVRSYNALTSAGLNTVGDLLQHSADELLELRNMGELYLKKVKEALDQYGYKLRQ